MPSSQVCILPVYSLTAAAAEEGLVLSRYSASAEPLIAMENTVSTGGKKITILQSWFSFLAAPKGSLQDLGSLTSYGILPLGHQGTPGLSSKKEWSLLACCLPHRRGEGGAEHPGDWKELNR